MRDQAAITPSLSGGLGALTDPGSRRGGRSALELAAGREGLPRLWRRHSAAWQIRLRWAVAPLMIGGALVGRLLGFDFRFRPILAIALATVVYNTLFALLQRRARARHEDYSQDRLLAFAGFALDYAAMFLLIHTTGGVFSPVSVFLIFHVIIAAIQFTATGAYLLAGIAAAVMWIFWIGQTVGWVDSSPLGFRGHSYDLHSHAALALVSLAFLSATLFITAGMVSRIVKRLRLRVGDLARATARLARTNDRLNGLYRVLSALGAEKRLKPVLSAVTEELGKVVEASAVAVKLLHEDGRTLRYAAVAGLPAELVDEIEIDVDESEAHRRVIDDSALVEVGAGAAIPLGNHLEALEIGGAALTPLEVDGRVIGILGYYYREARPLDDDDRSFARLTAELVAIAIDHARAHEKVRALLRERADFMLEVAHNLRAPVTASLGLLSLLLEGVVGEPSAEQRRHLGRVERRLQSLNEAIGELLAIARTRDRSREIEDVVVDLGELGRRTRELFEGQAEAKGLGLTVELEEGLPAVESGVGILEGIMENLVSNSIKYTPAGGRVEVRFENAGGGEVRITVADTGIGIPAAERGRMFEEFFRASNARATTVYGTGLGLVFVRQAVRRQGGRLELESQEGSGTTITLTLPTKPADSVA